MGGLGSGRRLEYTAKHQVEWCLVLDVGILAGRRVIPGDEGIVSLRAAACAWSVEAWFIVRNDGDLKLTVELPTTTGVVRTHLELTTARLTSGGKRHYFLCPGVPGGVTCGARVAKLYWPVKGRQAFACRRCHRLTYRSSQERTRTLEQLRRHFFGRPLPTVGASRRDPRNQSSTQA